MHLTHGPGMRWHLGSAAAWVWAHAACGIINNKYIIHCPARWLVCSAAQAAYVRFFYMELPPLPVFWSRLSSAQNNHPLKCRHSLSILQRVQSLPVLLGCSDSIKAASLRAYVTRGAKTVTQRRVAEFEVAERGQGREPDVLAYCTAQVEESKARAGTVGFAGLHWPQYMWICAQVRGGGGAGGIAARRSPHFVHASAHPMRKTSVSQPCPLPAAFCRAGPPTRLRSGSGRCDNMPGCAPRPPVSRVCVMHTQSCAHVMAVPCLAWVSKSRATGRVATNNPASVMQYTSNRMGFWRVPRRGRGGQRQQAPYNNAYVYYNASYYCVNSSYCSLLACAFADRGYSCPDARNARQPTNTHTAGSDQARRRVGGRDSWLRCVHHRQ